MARLRHYASKFEENDMTFLKIAVLVLWKYKDTNAPLVLLLQITTRALSLTILFKKETTLKNVEICHRIGQLLAQELLNILFLQSFLTYVT